MRLRLLATTLALAACDDASEDPRVPRIDTARPARARAGQEVALVGEGFGLRGDGDRVWFGGAAVVVEQWSEFTLLVRVPAAAGPGTHDFVVRTGAQVSRPFPFEVLPVARDGRTR